MYLFNSSTLLSMIKILSRLLLCYYVALGMLVLAFELLPHGYKMAAAALSLQKRK